MNKPLGFLQANAAGLREGLQTAITIDPGKVTVADAVLTKYLQTLQRLVRLHHNNKNQ